MKEITASEQIDARIKELSDWRGPKLAELRATIREAAPSLAEAWKWDTPTWIQGGNVCAAGVFKDHVKLNFFKGASLPDPKGLFNAGLEARATRAIDIFEGEELDKPALMALIQAAVKFNDG